MDRYHDHKTIDRHHDHKTKENKKQKPMQSKSKRGKDSEQILPVSSCIDQVIQLHCFLLFKNFVKEQIFFIRQLR